MFQFNTKIPNFRFSARAAKCFLFVASSSANVKGCSAIAACCLLMSSASVFISPRAKISAILSWILIFNITTEIRLPFVLRTLSGCTKHGPDLVMLEKGQRGESRAQIPRWMTFVDFDVLEHQALLWVTGLVTVASSTFSLFMEKSLENFRESIR